MPTNNSNTKVKYVWRNQTIKLLKEQQYYSITCKGGTSTAITNIESDVEFDLFLDAIYIGRYNQFDLNKEWEDANIRYSNHIERTKNKHLSYSDIKDLYPQCNDDTRLMSAIEASLNKKTRLTSVLHQIYNIFAINCFTDISIKVVDYDKILNGEEVIFSIKTANVYIREGDKEITVF
jgi:hypothetical protein